MKLYTIMLSMLFLCCLPFTVNGQEEFSGLPWDDLGTVSDDFKTAFFEALKQKGIENHEKAIEALQQCVDLDDSHPIIYFELGKNYNALKNFGNAVDALKKANSKKPNNEWILFEMYQVYLKQNDATQALKVLKSLVDIDPKYKRQQVSLYMQIRDYSKALKVLDELDALEGETTQRENLRNRIYKITGKRKNQIKNLEEKIDNNSTSEEDYLALIYRYSQTKNTKKAYLTAKELLKVKPESQLVHLALYKFYLEDKKIEQAINSMEIVFKSPEINQKAKQKVLSDFTNNTKQHPKYKLRLQELSALLLKDQTAQQSNYTQALILEQKDDHKQALYFYLKALEEDSDNFNIISKVLTLHMKLNEFETASKKSALYLETYPSQPILYLILGTSKNKLNKPKEALEPLLSGLDYIIEDKNMEIAFYQQLAHAYTLQNNLKKAQSLKSKIKKLQASK